MLGASEERIRCDSNERATTQTNPFQANPEGRWRFGRFSALLAPHVRISVCSSLAPRKSTKSPTAVCLPLMRRCTRPVMRRFLCNLCDLCVLLSSRTTPSHTTPPGSTGTTRLRHATAERSKARRLTYCRLAVPAIHGFQSGRGSRQILSFSLNKLALSATSQVDNQIYMPIPGSRLKIHAISERPFGSRGKNLLAFQYLVSSLFHIYAGSHVRQTDIRNA
jgi:hypothetical protein